MLPAKCFNLLRKSLLLGWEAGLWCSSRFSFCFGCAGPCSFGGCLLHACLQSFWEPEQWQLTFSFDARLLAVCFCVHSLTFSKFCSAGPCFFVGCMPARQRQRTLTRLAWKKLAFVLQLLRLNGSQSPPKKKISNIWFPPALLLIRLKTTPFCGIPSPLLAEIVPSLATTTRRRWPASTTWAVCLKSKENSPKRNRFSVNAWRRARGLSLGKEDQFMSRPCNLNVRSLSRKRSLIWWAVWGGQETRNTRLLLNLCRRALFKLLLWIFFLVKRCKLSMQKHGPTTCF